MAENEISLIKKLWRLTPLSLRTKVASFRSALARIRIVWRGNAPILTNPSYADDGLITEHLTEFLEDPKFIESYQLGEKTGALSQHPGDIHFRAYVACWAAKHASMLKGDFVECGVGKGLLSRTIVNYVDFNNIDKTFYLFDTFEGIPPDDSNDDTESKNIAFLNEAHFSYSYYEDVCRTFSDYKNVVISKGRIPEVFESVELTDVAYASIDMNNATGEMAAIEHLWSKLVIGGVVILDDYAYGPAFLKQKQAWDNFAKQTGFEILTLPTGQGLIIKNR